MKNQTPVVPSFGRDSWRSAFAVGVMRANRSAFRFPNGRAGGARDPVAMTRQLDMVIVGAGFAGLYMLHEARSLGLEVEVVEAGDGVGGTWYWNRYPGARCDTPSMEYSYGWHEALQQEWEWSEKYATQPEILAYSRSCRRPIRSSSRHHVRDAG